MWPRESFRWKSVFSDSGLHIIISLPNMRKMWLTVQGFILFSSSINLLQASNHLSNYMIMGAIVMQWLPVPSIITTIVQFVFIFQSPWPSLYKIQQIMSQGFIILCTLYSWLMPDLPCTISGKMLYPVESAVPQATIPVIQTVYRQLSYLPLILIEPSLLHFNSTSKCCQRSACINKHTHTSTARWCSLL